MATRNQVLSLFGATPQQVMERQRQQQAEFMATQRDPFQSAGAAIGLGLGRLFGGKSAEMQAAEQMQKAVAGIDPNDPAALRELAQTVSTFAPERALQIAAYAGELEKSQMSETVPVPAIVGYETEPDIDPLTGLQRTDENKQPLFKRTPIFRNVPFERTPQGLKSLVPGYSLPSGASNAVKDDLKTDTPQAPVPDYITNEEGVVVRNPAKTGAAPTPTAERTVTSNVSPEAAERMDIQSGPRGGGIEGSITGIAPPPRIQGELTYLNPEVLGEEIAALETQLSAMGRTSAGRKELQSRLNKLKAQQRKFKKKSSSGQDRRNR